MKPRFYLSLGVFLLHPGCAFFGVERSDCFPDVDCSVIMGDGDGDLPGDGDGGGDGDGDLFGSGGRVGDGDGDGDEYIYPSTGGGGGDGDGDGDVMGGAPGVGGRDGSDGGSGGEPTGGGGGVTSGGTGGDGDGGTGGDLVGGSGGIGSGGSGGGSGGNGSGGASPGDFEIVINEIYTLFVEVFLKVDPGTPVALDDFRIVVNDEEENACELTGVVLDSANPFYYAQKTALPCLEGSNCVSGCPFDTIGASMEVRLERWVDGVYEVVETQVSANTVLSGGESYQRRPNDGDENFVKAVPYSPGRSNVQ